MQEQEQEEQQEQEQEKNKNENKNQQTTNNQQEEEEEHGQKCDKKMCGKMDTICGMTRTSHCALHLRARAEHMNNTNAHTTIDSPSGIAGVRNSTIIYQTFGHQTEGWMCSKSGNGRFQ